MLLKAIYVIGAMFGTVFCAFAADSSVEILSLEEVLQVNDISAKWKETAFYVTGGSENLQIFKVIPGSGIFGSGAGVVVSLASQKRFLAVFISGKFTDLSEGNPLPEMNLKIDGTYQFKSESLGTMTLPAFRQLTSKEKEQLDEEIKRLRELYYAQKSAQQEKAKKEVEEFFSRLDLDVKKNFYLDRNLAGTIDIMLQRNVYLEDLRNAQLQKDWKQCLKIVYANFYKRNEKKPEILQENVHASEIFKRLVEYGFVEHFDNGEWDINPLYKWLYEEDEHQDWVSCLNLANEILQHPCSLECRTTLMEYPSLGYPKEILDAFLHYRFPLEVRVTDYDKASKVATDISFGRRRRRGDDQDVGKPFKVDDLAFLGFDSRWIVERNKCRDALDDQTKMSTFSMNFKSYYDDYKYGRPFFCSYFGDSDYERKEWVACLRMVPCYVAPVKTWEELIGKGIDEEEGNIRNEFTQLRNDFTADKIRSSEYIKGVVNVAKRIEDAVESRFVRVDKVQEVAEQKVVEPKAEFVSDNVATQQANDFSASDKNSDDEPEVLETNEITELDPKEEREITVEEARADKAEFARIWSAIKPEDPSAASVMQNLSRLRQGMENKTLAKIYGKYVEDECVRLLKDFNAAVAEARTRKATSERMAAREAIVKTYKEKFLRMLSRKMDEIINSEVGHDDSKRQGGESGSGKQRVTTAVCQNCNGVKFLKEEMPCKRCNGEGVEAKVKLGLNGTSRRVASKCPNCKGMGVEIKKTSCTTCKGTGRVHAE